MNKYRTQLKSTVEMETPFVSFSTDPEGFIEIQTSPLLIQDILHLLYFSANGHRIYNDQPADPPFFEKEVSVELTLDRSLFQALIQLLNDKKAQHIVQTIRCLNDSQEENWKSYLLIGLGFEVLFSLNPSFPAADLRQHLRPLLHLKFSHPVELLWKWVDQFYTFRAAILKGDHSLYPTFSENPNVETPLLLIGRKLLIYSLYDILFTKHLIAGSSGTPSTPDDFSLIHPDRLLVYFWNLETLQRKGMLLKVQPNSEKDLKMIEQIEAMHKKLQQTPSTKEKFIND